MRGYTTRIFSASKRFGRLFVALAFVALLVVTALPPRPQQTSATHGSGTHLYLLWDGADIDIPGGWSRVSDYDGRFPRGESVANFGTTGGNATHSISVTNLTVSGGSTNVNNGLAANNVASAGHSHPAPTSPTPASANNDPLHRTLKLIRYNAGIPTFIPAGAIAMFDGGGIPVSGWTPYSASQGRMIKIGSTVNDGGSDTHTHSLDWSASGLGASSGVANRQNLFVNTSAANQSHGHNAPPNNTTASITALPPYVEPLIAKADADTIAIPANLLGFFDGVPGSGWVLRSESGGTFNQKFLRPSAIYNDTAQGSPTATHDHANVAAITSGPTGGTQQNWSLAGGVAGGAHTHTLTASFSTGNDHMPQYFNVVIAEKINFILEDYRWYVDSDTEDVTDPWSSLDIAQDTAIPAIPVQSDPPDPGRELRLRIKITVSGQDLPSNDIAFILQYKAGTDATCTTGTWADVGTEAGGGIWRFASSGETNGEPLTNSRLSPASSVLQTYNKANPTGVNPNGATIGQGVEYDFHIQHNGAANATKYSFRLIESSGPLLAEYATCPTLTTRPGTENQLRHGNFFEGGFERGFSWVD